jgi:hypothetical protein
MWAGCLFNCRITAPPPQKKKTLNGSTYPTLVYLINIEPRLLSKAGETHFKIGCSRLSYSNVEKTPSWKLCTKDSHTKEKKLKRPSIPWSKEVGCTKSTKDMFLSFALRLSCWLLPNLLCKGRRSFLLFKTQGRSGVGFYNIPAQRKVQGGCQIKVILPPPPPARPFILSS